MHIMVDLETMGTRPDAPIVAIGAVRFDGSGIAPGRFYETVSLTSAVAQGAVMDPRTVLWWMDQSTEARREITRCETPLADALSSFAAYVEETPELSGVWGNGAAFDNVLLAESYARAGMVSPWPFWLDRCYRTVKSIHPDIPMDRLGAHHVAVDDAFTQAKHLIDISAAHGEFL